MTCFAAFPASACFAASEAALRIRVPVVFPGRTTPVLVRDEPRAAVAAVLDTPDGAVTVVATHLTFIPGWNSHQLRRLVRLLRGVPRPVVLMGDLNLDGDAPERISGWRSLAHAPTFPVAAPEEQLDHILVDGDLVPTGEGRAVDLGLSDHRALTVDVAPARNRTPAP